MGRFVLVVDVTTNCARCNLTGRGGGGVNNTLVTVPSSVDAFIAEVCPSPASIASATEGGQAAVFAPIQWQACGCDIDEQNSQQNGPQRGTTPHTSTGRQQLQQWIQRHCDDYRREEQQQGNAALINKQSTTSSAGADVVMEALVVRLNDGGEATAAAGGGGDLKRPRSIGSGLGNSGRGGGGYGAGSGYAGNNYDDNDDAARLDSGGSSLGGGLPVSPLQMQKREDFPSKNATTTGGPESERKKRKSLLLKALTEIHEILFNSNTSDIGGGVVGLNSTSDDTPDKATKQSASASSGTTTMPSNNSRYTTSIFRVIYSHTIPHSAILRQLAVQHYKYHMITHRTDVLRGQLGILLGVGGGYYGGGGNGTTSFSQNNNANNSKGLEGLTRAQPALYTCPGCGKRRLTSAAMWHHLPQFHSNDSDRTMALNGGQPHCMHPNCCSSTNRNSASSSSSSTPSSSLTTNGGSIAVGTPFSSMREYAEHYYYSHCPKNIPAPPPHRPDVRLYAFALVVVRRSTIDNKFLLVQEAGQRGWWLPGGGIDASESPIVGGVRETLEEAGVKVTIKGILSIQVQPSRSYTRMWYVFYAEPEDDTDCDAKTAPDHESVGACWVDVKEVVAAHEAAAAAKKAGRVSVPSNSNNNSGAENDQTSSSPSHLQQHHHLLPSQHRSLVMRGHEPLQWFTHVANGGPIYPMSMLQVLGGR